MLLPQQLQYRLMTFLSWLFTDQIKLSLWIGRYRVTLVWIVVTPQLLVTSMSWIPLRLQRLRVVLYVLLCLIAIVLRELT